MDSDSEKFSSEILHEWRERHEKYISLGLGNKTDKIQRELLDASLADFQEYPYLIRRIVIDKPEAWEFMLTAELLRHLNNPLFRRISDLHEGLYVKPYNHLTGEEILDWATKRLDEVSKMISPIIILIDKMNVSWGKPSEEGDLNEIHHNYILIRNYLEHVVIFEEKISFIIVPERYGKVIGLLKGLISSQVEKLKIIPERLDEIVFQIQMNSTNEIMTTIKETIVLEPPDNWEKQMNKEMRRLRSNYYESPAGCVGSAALAIVIGVS
ncbi:MAG: hypothetical protein OXC61_02275 [Flavobacteriaceae bacterium]|nr:hypothetical protein [Flavobacteriaceae bacterium]